MRAKGKVGTTACLGIAPIEFFCLTILIMVLFVNNQKREFAGDPSIVQLVQELRLESTRGLALAVNDRVISKTEWETFDLKEFDKVTIIRATQGG